MVHTSCLKGPENFHKNRYTLWVSRGHSFHFGVAYFGCRLSKVGSQWAHAGRFPRAEAKRCVVDPGLTRGTYRKLGFANSTVLRKKCLGAKKWAKVIHAENIWARWGEFGALAEPEGALKVGLRSGVSKLLEIIVQVAWVAGRSSWFEAVPDLFQLALNVASRHGVHKCSVHYWQSLVLWNVNKSFNVLLPCTFGLSLLHCF